MTSSDKLIITLMVLTALILPLIGFHLVQGRLDRVDQAIIVASAKQHTADTQKMDYDLFTFVQDLNEQHLKQHDKDIEILAKAFKTSDFYTTGSLQILLERIQQLEQKAHIRRRWGIKPQAGKEE